MSTAVVAVLVLLGALLAGLALLLWLSSSVVLVPHEYRLRPEFKVLDYRDGKVVLPSPQSPRLSPRLSPAQFADTRRHGTYGLLWSSGHGRLGPVVEDDGERVVRPLEVVAGSPPGAGEPARLDNFVYRRDPLSDHGLPYQDVLIESDAGELAAWWLPGDGPLGVLLLHGRRRGERAETLRVLPAIAERGRSVLVLAYRNHRGSPPSPDGFYHYGESEARDALAGVAFLAGHGAAQVVLYGFSMGGAAALEAVKRWPLAGPRLAGLVLDSPLVDPAVVSEQRIRLAGLPFPRLWAWATLRLAGWRSGVRWRQLDQRRSASLIEVPVLLVAGAADRTVPVEAVDAFAAGLGPRVRYHRVAAADHTEAWNRDPQAYQAWVRDFLEELERLP